MFLIWGLPYGLAALYDFLQGQEIALVNFPKIGSIIPNWLPFAWLLLGVILFVIVTFESAYRIVQNKTKSISGFLFEFNDSSMTTKDDKLYLGVSFFTDTEVVVNNLQLEINGKRFRPLNWSSFQFNGIHTKNYIFDLVKIRAVASNEWQDATFISIVDGVEYPSPLFQIHTFL